MYTKEQIQQSSAKCDISKTKDSIEDNVFQMDSFHSSDINFEDYSQKEVHRVPYHTKSCVNHV